MTFTPSYSAVQDPNTGKTITFTDTSNWSDNDEGYIKGNFSRIFVLTDAFDQPVDTLTITAGDTVVYPISTNKWLNVKLVITGGANTFEKSLKWFFQRIFELAYNEVLKPVCGCVPKRLKMDEVDSFVTGAEFAAPIGDAADYQNNIDAAYAILMKN